jgi:general secretion pathway protein E
VLASPVIPYVFARSQGILVVGESGAGLEVLSRVSTTASAMAEVRRTLGRPLRVRTVADADFDAALGEAYAEGYGPAAAIVDDAGQELDLSQLMHDLPAVEDLLDAQDEAPIIRMVNALLTQAVREGASDVHVEAFEKSSVVRFRRDGMMRDVAEPHRALHAALVSRIKIMANLDIAERRLPQDGRISLRLGGRTIDVRVSTLPTAHGERAVLRLLDKDQTRLRLDALGMSPLIERRFARLLAEPHGIVLVSGPTGSGKTTTLYAALSGMDVRQRNIVTVEDPVEFDLPGIGQTQVNPRIALDFARALRAILRQDPDVIMIGEIRDVETARIAVQASLTGHLVLATVHTNDAVSAVTRLVDMGVEPFLLASTLRGVLAQRLVRRLCPECRIGRAADAADREILGADCPPTLWQAAACPACTKNGYRGRTGIYELLTIDDELTRLIHSGAAEHALRDAARRAGFVDLRSDGLRYLASGDTTPEELLRVTRD